MRASAPADSSVAPQRGPSSERPLTAVPWSLGSAIRLVALAMTLVLLAGAIAQSARGRGWSSQAEALVVGGALLLAYAGQMSLVWWTAKGLGVGFGAAVGLRRADRAAYWTVVAAAVAGAVWLFSVAYSAALAAWGIHLPGQDLQVLRILPEGPLGRAIMLALIVFIAPLAEEVVFRGVLLSALRDRWGTRIAIVGSALLFALVHVSLYSLLPLVVLSVVLGWLFVASRSLWVSILGHVVFNALGVIALLVTAKPGLL